MFAVILARLGERSTWQGLAALAGIAGVSIAPDQLNAIVTAVGAVFAVVHIFFPQSGTFNAAA